MVIPVERWKNRTLARVFVIVVFLPVLVWNILGGIAASLMGAVAILGETVFDTWIDARRTLRALRVPR